MGDIIKKLSTITSNQIAAGEVVKRPSSVVKELMENAIDAQSTMVIVNIEDGGKELIHVIDDGVGMSFNDAFAAFERHATSKIVKTDDLFALKTFGFRGEALPSIASVSEIELKSCRDKDELGCRVVINGGELVKHIKEMTTKGTQISVRKLFYNVPQRRNFLKAPSSELKHIINEFKKIALCNPQISLFLYSNKKCLYNLPIGTLRNRVNNIIGKNINHQLMEVSVNTSIIEINGYIGSPESASQQSEQFMFVNGRYFRTAYFNKAVTKAYENVLPNSKAIPRYFLYFSVNPAEIDVNGDPEKVDVKFENESQIWQILFSLIKSVLGRNGIMPSIDFEVSSQIDFDNQESFSSMAKEATRTVNSAPTPSLNDEYNTPDYNIYNGKSYEKRVSNNDSESVEYSEEIVEEVKEKEVAVERIKVDDDIDNIMSSSFLVEPDFQSVAELVEGFEASDDMILSSSFFDFDVKETEDNSAIYEQESSIDFGLSDSKYSVDLLGDCTLFASSYIIAPIGDNVLFINIISALKRVCFDKYNKMINRVNVGVVNKLIFPINIPLSVYHSATVSECLVDLRSIGFEIEIDIESGVITITGIPTGYDKYNIYDVVEDILASVSGDDIEGYNQMKRDSLIKKLANVEAVKRSKSMKKDECRALVAELLECDNFRFTQSGKPIFAELNKKNIEELIF